MTNKKSTEDHIKEVEQDDRIIQFDNGEGIFFHDEDEKASPNVRRALERLEKWNEEDWKEFAKNNPIDPAVVQYLEDNELLEGNMGEGKAEVVKAFAKAEGIPIHSIGLPDLDKESKRSDRFFNMRLLNMTTDDIENKFLAMFAEFIVLMALFISMLGFGVLLWAIFG